MMNFTTLFLVTVLLGSTSALAGSVRSTQAAGHTEDFVESLQYNTKDGVFLEAPVCLDPGYRCHEDYECCSNSCNHHRRCN